MVVHYPSTFPQGGGEGVLHVTHGLFLVVSVARGVGLLANPPCGHGPTVSPNLSRPRLLLAYTLQSCMITSDALLAVAGCCRGAPPGNSGRHVWRGSRCEDQVLPASTQTAWWGRARSCGRCGTCCSCLSDMSCSPCALCCVFCVERARATEPRFLQCEGCGCWLCARCVSHFCTNSRWRTTSSRTTRVAPEHFLCN
jgi:hypothetical protein